MLTFGVKKGDVKVTLLRTLRTDATCLTGLAIVFAVLACGDENDEPHELATDLAQIARSGGARPVQASTAASRRAAFIRSRQQGAGPEYAVQASGTSAMATNAAHGFDISFVDGAVAVRPTTRQSWALTLTLIGVARHGDGLAPVSVPLPSPTTRASIGEHLRVG